MNGLWTISATKSQAGFLALETGATVNVYLAGTENAATIFSDADGTAKDNPFTLGSSASRVEFFADIGALYKVVISKGDTSITLDNQAVNFSAVQSRTPDFFTISGNVTLDSTHKGKTGYITGDAVITLPVYADEDAGYAVELVRDGQAEHAVTFAAQGADTVRDGETVLDGDAAVMRTPTLGQWAIIGQASAP